MRLRDASPAQRRTLVAAALGWMLDAFDVMLYALVMAHVITAFGMSKATAGNLVTLTLLASGIGGVLFGFLADRIGRTRALMLSILTYSVASVASGLSTSIAMLAACRFVLGLGMGGEWNTGATLVAETWPTELRARALSLVQSSWAIGYALAAVVAGALLPIVGWRGVFFAGVAPALVVLWMRVGVPESPMWQERARANANAAIVPNAPPKTRETFATIFTAPYRRATFALVAVNFFGMFAWWGLFSWVPAYLQLPTSAGGRGFDAAQTTTILVALNLTGILPGYASFGWVCDRLGRRRAFIVFLALAGVLVPLYAMARDPVALLVLGTPVAFFGTGFFTGSGIVGSEIFPTAIRARALGVTYNGARTLSAVAPAVIGAAGERWGLSAAFFLCAGSYLAAALVATQLPETKGRALS